MKTIVGLVIAGFIAMFAWSGYNTLVTYDEGVNAAWSETQSQLKRRADLIPNLVKTVEGYASHERGVFTQVTEARSKIGQVIKVDASKIANDPALQKQLLDAQQALNTSLGRLIAVAENYPQLKANENFVKLQDELAGSENRIAVARGRAIKATRDYNQASRRFPTVIIARIGGFGAKQYYEAPEGDQQVPKVEFKR